MTHNKGQNVGCSPQKAKKRRVNFRSFLLIAGSISTAIILARLFFVSIVLSLLAMAVLVLCLAVFAVIVFKNSRDIAKFVSLVAALVLSICSFCVFVSEVTTWGRQIESGKTYTVSGEVSYNLLRYETRTVVLHNVMMNGRSVRGKIRIYIKEADGKTEFAKEGDVISFTSKVTITNIYNNYRHNTRYYASVSDSDISLDFGKPSFFQSVRIKIRSVLYANLNEDFAEISYSMLTGDKNYLAPEINDYFCMSGLAHILAVSGLHIGFMALLITWILKKLRVGRVTIFVSVSLALVFYVFVADFSPSVLRATIMSIIGLLGTLKGARRDTFNNLCLAMSLILFARPLYLFDVCFLLSVSAVLGLIFFAPPLVRAMQKIKFPRYLAQSIATPLSVQIGAMPVLIYFFGTISIYSIMANILLMQVIMATYMLLVVGVVLTIIAPFLGFIIKGAGLGLFVIDGAAKTIASFPLSVLIVFSTLPILVCYVFYFIASRFVRKDRHAKIISWLALALCAIIMMSGNYSYKISGTITPVSTPMYDVTSVVAVDDKVYLIGDMQSSSDALSALIAIRARKLDAVLITKLNQKTVREIMQLEYLYKGFMVYFPLSETMSGLDELSERYQIKGYSTSAQIVPKISIEFDENQKFVCYRLADQANAVFFGISANLEKTPQDIFDSADIIRSFGYVDSGAESKVFLPNVGQEDGSENVIAMQDDAFVIYNYKNKKTKQVR